MNSTSQVSSLRPALMSAYTANIYAWYSYWIDISRLVTGAALIVSFVTLFILVLALLNQRNQTYSELINSDAVKQEWQASFTKFLLSFVATSNALLAHELMKGGLSIKSNSVWLSLLTPLQMTVILLICILAGICYCVWCLTASKRISKLRKQLGS
jgi:hypothetical protein